MQLDNKAYDNMAINSTENTGLTTVEYVARQITKIPVENVNTE